jgi:hypothetical protein
MSGCPRQPKFFCPRAEGSKRLFDDFIGRFSGISTFVRMSGVPLVARGVLEPRFSRGAWPQPATFRPDASEQTRPESTT